MTQTLHNQTELIQNPLKSDMDLLRTSVQKAGALALEYQHKSLHTSRKTDGTEVSEADLAVNAQLKADLCGARPDYGWLSEEDEDDSERLNKRRIWIVDPIDGTRAFLRGRPDWTISAGLVENGIPVAGSVFNPVNQEFFEAVKGQGARLNNRLIHVTAQTSIEDSRIIAAHDILRSKFWSDPWPKFERQWVNSMAYRLALVASGFTDATFSLSKKHDWDLAAAHVIVKEAGGCVTSRLGIEPVYNNPKPIHKSTMASNPVLHEALCKQMKSFRH